jgi:hypothetical protein
MRLTKSEAAMLMAGQEPEKPKKNKYGAKKIEIDGHKFDSQAEGRRYAELKLQQHCGIISDLELQPVFILQSKFKYDGKVERSIKYVADFQYEKDGKTIIEDTKGKRTAVYKIKRKMLLFHYPDINFVETA